MDSKQFAWLYLLENGMGGVTKSYYGGTDVIDKRVKQFATWDTNKQMEQIHAVYFAEIKAYGIDWNKTKEPESEDISMFQGTFCDAKEVEYLSGVLVLNNGTKQQWIAEAISVSNVFAMMAAVHDAEARFKALIFSGSRD